MFYFIFGWFFFFLECLYPLSCLREAAPNVWGSVQMESRGESWMWPDIRSSLGKWLKPISSCSLLLGYYCCFLISVKYWGGRGELGTGLGEFWLIKVLEYKKHLANACWRKLFKNVFFFLWICSGLVFPNPSDTADWQTSFSIKILRDVEGMRGAEQPLSLKEKSYGLPVCPSVAGKLCSSPPDSHASWL